MKTQNIDIEAVLKYHLIEGSVKIQKVKPPNTNYKIGNAYAIQKKYKKAIPYLEKSREEASKREDLVVEKDANRKLSEVYDATGN